MARPPKWRRVEFLPDITYFKPIGVSLKFLDEVILNVEELEAIRLKDVEGLEQEECAQHMEISRPTFVRVLNSARSKVAEALIQGKAIRIEGGNYEFSGDLRCLSCGDIWEETMTGIGKEVLKCPRCKSPKWTLSENECRKKNRRKHKS